jgi:phosphoglycolate phosphatase
MACRGVIFDLDGTLLDTIDDLADSMNAALGKLGFPLRTVAECKTLVGDGLETFVRRALPPEARNDDRAAHALRELMKAEYRLRLDAKTRPYPGIVEALAALAERGIPMAVLSNKPHPETVAIVLRYFPQIGFAVVLGARDGVPVKPDPAGALEIAARMGLRPADIAYLGDTNTDMQTAVAAGMLPIGALWGFRTREELLANGAAILLEKPGDLLGLGFPQ